MSRRRRTVGIDLFSGAGGMTLGARNAGIDVLYAVEKCRVAAATYKLNFPGTPMFVGDIRNLKALPSKPKNARSVLFGGPPCQGFSTSNQRNRSAGNPSNWLFEEFVRLVHGWNPDCIVMENVKGITQTDGGSFVKIAMDAFAGAGYEVHFELLNAVGYGVPQKRTRAFFVGVKENTEFEFPSPETRRSVSVIQAIGDLPLLSNGASVDELPYSRRATNKFARLLRKNKKMVTGNLVTNNNKQVIQRYLHVPQGGNWEDIPENLLLNYKDRQRCHTGIYKRLHEGKPSVVIGNFRKNMLIHPREDRGLSIREAARIQSLPDDFCFSGSIGFQQQQVGNMVPPLLSQAVFQQFKPNE